MKSPHRLWVTLGIAVAAIAAWLLLSRTARVANPGELTIFFTGDVRGRLVPCGCFTGQLGGLTRVATMIGKGAAPEMLKVDIGDAIAGSADYEVIQYRSIQKAFARMGYEALNAGHREAALPLAELQRLKAGAPVPIVSANLLEKSSRRPVFEPFRIVTRGSRRIAIVGVMDPRVGDALGDGLVVEKMETALVTLLPELKKKTDGIVLLAFTDEAGMAELARQFYEIDVILGGKVSQPSQKLVRENRSAILATTNQSRALGSLKVSFARGGKLTALEGEVVLVSDGIPQDPEIRALADAYREEVRTTKLAIDDPDALQGGMVPGVKALATYSGSQSCAACHPTAMARWTSSGHSHAFATLVKARADADPNCIGCHTVGFGTPTGYRREFQATKLVDVGCESCHGPGSQHVAERVAGGEPAFRFRKLGGGDCVKCHHGEFSRPFKYEDFWPLVSHGREPVTRPLPGKPLQGVR